MSESYDLDAAANGLVGLKARTAELTTAATTFSRTMTDAFPSSAASGRRFGDVLNTLAAKIASLSANPSALPSIVSSMIGSLGRVKAFAAGGVIGTPSYFPMAGGVGLAGEAGPEAILPLQRAADGRLGIAGQGGGAVIHVQIATPDLESFRRSESYLTGQIARAVARGQRSL